MPSLPVTHFAPDNAQFCPAGFRQNAQGKGSAEGSKKEQDKFRPHICPQCKQVNFEQKGTRGVADEGTAETPRWGGYPPDWVGQASRPAIRRPHSPRAEPRHPLPLKGCKSAIQRKAPHAEFAPLKQRKDPWQRGLRIAPVFSKKRDTGMAHKICV